MDMYPDNQELTLNGEKVMWPGVDASGKFTNGDFNDPLVPPSFIPAETINLILDNLAGLIKRSGGTPDNTSITQLADAIDRRFIQIFQNGYIQWPWMPKPETVFTFEGYRWAEVDYDGCFFRAKGESANPFNGDIQQEGLPNITGHFYSHSIGLYDSGGALKESGDISGNYRKFAEGDGLGVSVNVFDAANSNNIYGASKHVTPRNLTFIIWKLEKI